MGSILNDTSNEKDAPLVIASSNGNTEMVKALLSFKEINRTISGGKYRATALHGAVDNKHLEIVKLLLEDPYLSKSEKMEYLSAVDFRSRTAMDLARRYDSPKTLEVSRFSQPF